MTFGPIRGLTSKPAPGARVRFTDYFMSSVPNAVQGRWVIVDCACGLCRSGRHVAVNEPPPHDSFFDDVPLAQRMVRRHFNWTNLQQVFDTSDNAPETPRATR